VFPQNQGTMVATGTISAFSLTDLPIDGAASWAATMALSDKPHLRY
jgi:hypothetical protein